MHPGLPHRRALDRLHCRYADNLHSIEISVDQCLSGPTLLSQLQRYLDGYRNLRNLHRRAYFLFAHPCCAQDAAFDEAQGDGLVDFFARWLVSCKSPLMEFPF